MDDENYLLLNRRYFLLDLLQLLAMDQHDELPGCIDENANKRLINPTELKIFFMVFS